MKLQFRSKGKLALFASFAVSMFLLNGCVTLEQECEKGKAESCGQLGVSLFFGPSQWGGKDKAEVMFEEGCDKNDALSCYYLASEFKKTEKYPVACKAGEKYASCYQTSLNQSPDAQKAIYKAIAAQPQPQWKGAKDLVTQRPIVVAHNNTDVRTPSARKLYMAQCHAWTKSWHELGEVRSCYYSYPECESDKSGKKCMEAAKSTDIRDANIVDSKRLYLFRNACAKGVAEGCFEVARLIPIVARTGLPGDPSTEPSNDELRFSGIGGTNNSLVFANPWLKFDNSEAFKVACTTGHAPSCGFGYIETANKDGGTLPADAKKTVCSVSASEFAKQISDTGFKYKNIADLQYKGLYRNNCKS